MLLKEVFDDQYDMQADLDSLAPGDGTDEALSLRVTASDHPKFKYECIDYDSYDGAPDASPVNRIIGYGNTADEARNDWIEQRSEYGN